jgi:hypothetical protein
VRGVIARKEWIKIASILMVLVIGLSALPLVSFAETTSNSSDQAINQQNVVGVVNDWVNRLKETIRTSAMISEQNKEKLMSQLDTALQLANKGDIQGAIREIMNVTRQYTVMVNEQARERIRQIVEEKVKAIQQIRDLIPPEARELIKNANKTLDEIGKGKINPEEIHKVVKPITITKREIEKSQQVCWNIVKQIATDEESKEYLGNMTGTYIPTGLTALLYPAQKLIENVKFMAQRMGNQDILNITSLLEESISLIKQAVAKFGQGDYEGFNTTISLAKEKLDQAKELIVKPTSKKMGTISLYNMLLTASRMIELTVMNVEKVLGGMLNENKVMVKGVVLQYNNTTNELVVLGSMHVVVKSPENKLRSAGFAPVIGSWTVKITNETKINGNLTETAIVLVIGKSKVDNGKIIVIADEIYANNIKELSEVENEVEETAPQQASAIIGVNA